MARKKGNVGRLYVTSKEKEILDAVLRPIQAEFHEALNDIAGTHAVASKGLWLVREELLAQAKDAPDPERYLIFGHGDHVKDPKNAIGFTRWQFKSLPDKLAVDGPVAQRLGWQWATQVYAEWEEEYRPRLAEAAGVDKNVVSDPMMADVGKIRHDIIHCKGKATERNTGRCEVLDWFRPGDPVMITTERVAEFMARIGLVTLP